MIHTPYSSGLAYQTFLDGLPYRPLATDDFRRGVRAMSPRQAAACRNIAPDRPYAVDWLKFDLDLPGSAARWIDEDLPRPHFVVVNQAHYLYALRTPVLCSGRARRAPLDYLNAVTTGYTTVLHADPAYAGKFCKTPLHPSWQTFTHDGPLYTLEMLASALPPRWVSKKTPRDDVLALGRNVLLFDALRQQASPLARSAQLRGDYLVWSTAVLGEAVRLNTFTHPLHLSEVRSVARWTWLRRPSVVPDVRR